MERALAELVRDLAAVGAGMRAGVQLDLLEAVGERIDQEALDAPRPVVVGARLEMDGVAHPELARAEPLDLHAEVGGLRRDGDPAAAAGHGGGRGAGAEIGVAAWSVLLGSVSDWLRWVPSTSVTVAVIGYGGSSLTDWRTPKRKQRLAAGLSSTRTMLCGSLSSQCRPAGASLQPGIGKGARQWYWNSGPFSGVATTIGAWSCGFDHAMRSRSPAAAVAGATSSSAKPKHSTSRPDRRSPAFMP